MPSALEKQLQRHRRQIIEREEQAFRELLIAYEQVERDLNRQYRELQRRILAAQAAGEEISPSWFYRERRLQSLLDQVKQQIERFGFSAAAITAREQRAAITIGSQQTREVFRVMSSASSASLGSLLPTRVVEDAVGMMGNGSPIFNYYSETLAPAVVEKIRTEVIKAAATGTDFRTIARRLTQTGDITRQRALMVARTEVNRVRREAARQTMIESGIAQKWEWVASKSIRTCPACLWLDGQRFDLKDAFPQHPNCRCTMIPVLDVPDLDERLTGREWVETLGPEDLEEIFGKQAAAAIARGDIGHGDMVGWKNSKEFGRSIYTKSFGSVAIGGANKP